MGGGKLNVRTKDKQPKIQGSWQEQRCMRYGPANFMESMFFKQSDARGRTVRPHAEQILGAMNAYGSEGPTRGSKPLWCELVSFNSSGKRQLVAALNFLEKRRADGVMVAAAAVQEHWAAGDVLCDLQSQTRKGGWKLSASAAMVDGASRSAGVGVCVRSHIESGRAQNLSLDMSPPGHPGRVAAVFVDGFC